MDTTTLRDARATFTDANWREDAYAEADGVKLVKAHFERTYRGDLEARSSTDLLMVYLKDGSCTFSGLERVEGRVFGREGSFVIQHVGEWRDGFATSQGRVLPSSGTGQLASIAGDASYKAGHAPEHSVVFRLGVAEANAA